MDLSERLENYQMTDLLILILLIILSVGVGIGFDLRKPASWLYVLCGLLIGFLLGTTGNFKQAFVVGLTLAVVAAWGGPIMYKRRHHKDE